MKKKLALVALALSPLAVFAEGSSVSITAPVDMTSYITAGVTALGAVVAAAVAAYCGFLLVRKGIKWINKGLN